MELTLVILTGIALAVVFVMYLAKIGPFGSKTRSVGTDSVIASLTYKYSAEPGKRPAIQCRGPLANEILLGIEEAFAQRIRDARLLGWSRKLQPELYSLLIFPSERDYAEDGTYAPSFRVYFDSGSAYDESVFDKMPGEPGGYVLAAEQVFIKNGSPTDTFVIAANHSQAYTTTAVANGLDHLFSFYNDPSLYERTKYHNDGISHPLW